MGNKDKKKKKHHDKKDNESNDADYYNDDEEEEEEWSDKTDYNAPTKKTQTKRKYEMLFDSLSPTDMDICQPRTTRRKRKTPTIYDPQSGAASEWQTDAFKNWDPSWGSKKEMKKAMEKVEREKNKNREKDKKKDKKDKKIHRDKSQKKESTVVKVGESPIVTAGVTQVPKKFWCNFCNDDPEITVCCFCSCRVCFSKHDEVSHFVKKRHPALSDSNFNYLRHEIAKSSHLRQV